MNTKYDDFIPARVTNGSFVITVIILLLQYAEQMIIDTPVLSITLMVLFLISFAITLFLYFVNRRFSFEKGRLLVPVLKTMMKRLSFKGKGTILDYGCGLGAYTVALAKNYKHATISGVDQFKSDTDFSDAEINIKMEKVKKRTSISNVQLKELDNHNESVDAVTSCFGLSRSKVYKDGLDEALRVLKKGGVFCFVDYFDEKKHYQIDEIMDELKKSGYSDVQYVSHIENDDNIPRYVRLPHIYKNVGMLYGRK